MITGDKLLALLDKSDKTDRDLIRYVCNGLRAYDVNQRPVYPARLLLVTWQEEAARVAETHLLFEQEAARLDVSARDLMTEHLAHRRVMQDMKAEDAERYRLSIPSEVLKELLSRDVTIKQLIENLPDGENRRMVQLKFEAASFLKMLSREIFESAHSRLNALIALVSGGEPIPLQWFLDVFTNTAIDGLAAELMECYYERKDVQRFIDADTGVHDTAISKHTCRETTSSFNEATSWDQVSILIVNPNMAEVTIGADRKNVDRESLGFIGYGEEPSELWKVFQAFASHAGVLKPDYLPTEINNRKSIKNDISSIRKKLKNLFPNIPDQENPITYDAKAKLYKSQFKLTKKVEKD